MRIKLTLTLLSALALGACSSGPARVAKGPAPTVAAVTEIDAAFDLLMHGDQAGAQKRLKAILKRDPMNANARLLSDSIGRDPKELLGPQSHPYIVGAGDTMVSLAERFLGNRLKAYQLLRYNNLQAPAVLAPGQVVRIPGEPPRSEPIRRLEPSPAPSRPVSASPAPPKAKPVPAANPAAARQLRTAGLTALNQGAVARAVALLRHAAQLDPGNPIIARDLARAQRIAATVQTKK